MGVVLARCRASIRNPTAGHPAACLPRRIRPDNSRSGHRFRRRRRIHAWDRSGNNRAALGSLPRFCIRSTDGRTIRRRCRRCRTSGICRRCRSSFPGPRETHSIWTSAAAAAFPRHWRRPQLLWRVGKLRGLRRRNRWRRLLFRSFPTSILRTYEFGRISQRPVFTAAGISAASVLDFAPTSHPNASQYPQCMQAGRPLYCCEMIASGAGNGCRPSFFAPRSNNTPDDFTGIGGSG